MLWFSGMEEEFSADGMQAKRRRGDGEMRAVVRMCLKLVSKAKIGLGRMENTAAGG